MLAVLLMLEITTILAAMSVVAWLRYPAKSDDFHLGLLRFLGPSAAFVVLLDSIYDIVLWFKAGRPSGLAPPVVTFGGAMVALAAIAWAVSEWRQRGNGPVIPARKLRPRRTGAAVFQQKKASKHPRRNRS